MVHKLPVEIISKIFTYLSIKDARICADVYDISVSSNDIKRLGPYLGKIRNIRNVVRQVLADRESDQIYMAQSFPDTTEMMMRMTVYGAWASGSRVLDFFAGQSIGPDSDWDFYIPTDTKKVIYFMEYMKTIGVTWISTVDYYIDRIKSNDKDIIMSYADLEYLNNYTGPGIPDYIKQFIANICDDDHEVDNLQSSDHIIYGLETSDGCDCIVRIHTGTYGSTSIDSIIRGKLLYRGVETSIQLILTGTEKNANLDAIRNFDLSIVQGAITGFMTFHMYSDHAYSRSGSIWIVDDCNEIQRSSTKERVKKYIQRGYRFQDGSTTINENCMSSNRIIKRSIGDAGSDTILPDSYIDSEQDSYLAMRQDIYNYKWIEMHSTLSEDFIAEDQESTMMGSIIEYLNSKGFYDVRPIGNILLDSTSKVPMHPKYTYPFIDKNYYNKFRPLVYRIDDI